MPKRFNCANCGIVLAHTRKAFKGRIYDLIEPHDCDEVSEPEPGDGTTFVPSSEKVSSPDYNQFKFVQKINDLAGKLHEPVDHRKSDHLREEKNDSTAPLDLLKNVKDLPNQTPERDL